MSRHISEVIEVYPDEGKAAIKFSWRNRDRIESVISKVEGEL